MHRSFKLFLLVLTLCAALCVTAVAADYEAAAQELSAIGMFRGTGTGFELDRKPTRAEAAIMLVRLYGAEEQAQADYAAGLIAHPFADVPGYAAPHVAWLYSNGLTKGMSANTFGSAQDCTVQNYATFLLRALGWQDGVDFAYADALTTAAQVGFYQAELFPGDFLRDDLAALTYQALAADTRAGDSWLLAQLIERGAVNADAAQPMTEKMELYRALMQAGDPEDLDALDMDLTLDYSILYTANGGSLESKASNETKLTYRGEGADFQAAYLTTVTADDTTLSTDLWIKDGWQYIAMDMEMLGMTLKVKYPMTQEEMAELQISGESQTVVLSELAMVKSITVEKQGRNTVYTLVLDGNNQALSVLAGESFAESIPEGAVLNSMTFADMELVCTVDKEGVAISQVMTFLCKADLTLAAADGSQQPLTMVLDYTLDQTINAYGSKVRVTFPDLSEFQEIDPSLLEE